MPLGEVQSGCSARATPSCAAPTSPRSTSRSRRGRRQDQRRGAADPRQGVGPRRRRDRHRPGLLRLADLLRQRHGTQRVIGAISESIGEYGGKVVLATPIESIARQARSTRRTPARARRPRAEGPADARAGEAAHGAADGRRAAARGSAPRCERPRPRSTGASCSPRRPGRSARSRCRRCEPGAAFGVGYSDGDIAAARSGRWPTPTATGLGLRAPARRRRRAGAAAPGRLRLPRDQQPARDRRLDRHATSTRRAGHDVGTLTNDALDAVVGRVGALPPTRAGARLRDRPRHRRRRKVVQTDVADESSVDEPTGGSILVVHRAARGHAGRPGTVLDGSPARLTGDACFAICLRERPQAGALLQPLRDRRARPARRGQRHRRLGRAADLFAALSLVDIVQRDAPCTSRASTSTSRSDADSTRRSCASVKLPRRGSLGRARDARRCAAPRARRLERRR